MKSTQEDFHKIAEIRRKAEEFANDAAKTAMQRFLIENPSCPENLALKPLNRVFVKRPKGYSQVVYDIAQCLFHTGYLEKTQAEITREMAEKHPEHSVTDNIWTKDFTAWERKRVNSIVQGSMVKPISMKGCNTLSELRKRLVANWKSGMAELKLKPSISFSKKTVTVNNRVYPIQASKTKTGHAYQRIHVPMPNGKQSLMNVDVLVALLMAK